MKLTNLLKQYHMPLWIGAYYTQIMISLSYISILNTAMIAVTMWITSGDSIRAYLPWMTFPLFVAIVVVVVFVAVPFLDYKFMMKTRQKYQWKQSYFDGLPITDDLKKLKENDEKMGIKLDRIEKLLSK